MSKGYKKLKLLLPISDLVIGVVFMVTVIISFNKKELGEFTTFLLITSAIYVFIRFRDYGDNNTLGE